MVPGTSLSTIGTMVVYVYVHMYTVHLLACTNNIISKTARKHSGATRKLVGVVSIEDSTKVLRTHVRTYVRTIVLCP
jgi:hypothetical protein